MTSSTRAPLHRGPDATRPPHREGREREPGGGFVFDPSVPLHQQATRVDARHCPIAVIGPQGEVCLTSGAMVSAASIEDLGYIAGFHGITQFWIHESALPSLGMPLSMHMPTPGDGLPHAFTSACGPWKQTRPGLKMWGHWWQRGMAGFDLHIPAYAGRSSSGKWVSPFAGTDGPWCLLSEARSFYDATHGARWCGAGSITSDNWLRGRLKGRLAPTEEPPPIEDGSALELAYMWHRTPGEDERGFRYVHGLDLNLSYAAPVSSLELPTGRVEHRPFPCRFDPRLPGVYLFEPGPWPGSGPPPWGSGIPWEEEGVVWVTAPAAERMVQLGYEPIEAWVWPDHGRHLRGWYEMLRDARLELLGGGPALQAVKQTCRMGLGRLSSERRSLTRGAESLEDDPLFQPYWDWAAIAELRCRLQRRVSQLKMTPVAVHTDAVYFLSSRRDPEAVAHAFGLPLGDGLGQFKSAGSCSARDAREALALSDSSAAVTALAELMA